MPERDVLAGAGQLLLVLADDWSACSGSLQRYVRSTPADPWQPVGAPIPVSLGKSGLAWGRGLHPAVDLPGRQKMEGDGCAPVGVFGISALFGEGVPAWTPGLPYYPISTDLKAVDDPASRYYNRLVAQSTVAAVDWVSHEEMRRTDACYAIGAVVDHNSDPVMPGAGSCIFLHVWRGEGLPTEGCTAASLAAMTMVCTWLDVAASPRLVQLPLAVYRGLAVDWGLPAGAA